MLTFNQGQLFALLGRAGPAYSTPLFFMGLLMANTQRPIKKGGL
jgi:hypothetical protein